MTVLKIFLSSYSHVLLSLFSHVLLFSTLWPVAHQVHLSMGFSSQEYWSGLPFPPLGDLLNLEIEPTSFTSPALAVGEGNGTPLQYSCLENPMNGGAWQAAVHGVARSRTQLSDFTFTFHFHALEKEMQPTPVFFPGESQGRGSLVGCRLWGRTEWTRLN